MRNRNGYHADPGLLVVIAIIAVLIALLSAGRSTMPHEAAPGPVHQQPRSRFGLAIHNYDSVVERFPVGYFYPLRGSGLSRASLRTTMRGRSWRNCRRPSEQTTVYNAMNFEFLVSWRAERQLWFRALWHHAREFDGADHQGQRVSLPERRRHAAPTRRVAQPTTSSTPGMALTSNLHPPAGDLSGANGAFIMSMPQSVATIIGRVEQYRQRPPSNCWARPRRPRPRPRLCRRIPAGPSRLDPSGGPTEAGCAAAAMGWETGQGGRLVGGWNPEYPVQPLSDAELEAAVRLRE